MEGSLVLGLLVLFISQSTAHFLLNYPPTIGFADSMESTPPCGSFSVDFSTDNVTNFHVAGDSIAVTSIHPQATWLFRATLDITASGNWTTLLPAIVQTGLGAYCEQDILVPASFAGSKGVIQVVQDAPDGILYQVSWRFHLCIISLFAFMWASTNSVLQCAAVNFVAGSIAPPSVCTNVTGLTAAYTSDPALSSLPASTSAASSASMTSSTASSTSSSTSTSTPKSSDTTTVRSYSGLSLVAWVITIASVTFMACLL